MYKYGMRLRGFSIGCQPMKNFIRRMDDPTGKYHDIICYSEKLSDSDLAEYELDFIGLQIYFETVDLALEYARNNNIENFKLYTPIFLENGVDLVVEN